MAWEPKELLEIKHPQPKQLKEGDFIELTEHCESKAEWQEPEEIAHTTSIGS